MKKELILKLGFLVYAKLFDSQGNELNENFLFFEEKNKGYNCNKIFWRFYYVESTEDC